MKTNLKPFDLKTALNGEPVMLRSGEKAFVRHHETELEVPDRNKLLGYCDGGCLVWREDGNYFTKDAQTGYDIIGMYPKTRTINGFEVPAPETEELDYDTHYCLALTLSEYFYRDEIWQAHHNDKLWLGRGLVFLNEEDAVANTKAMLGIDPNKPSTD